MLVAHSAQAQTSSSAPERPRFQGGVSFAQAFAVGDFAER